MFLILTEIIFITINIRNLKNYKIIQLNVIDKCQNLLCIVILWSIYRVRKKYMLPIPIDNRINSACTLLTLWRMGTVHCLFLVFELTYFFYYCVSSSAMASEFWEVYSSKTHPNPVNLSRVTTRHSYWLHQLLTHLYLYIATTCFLTLHTYISWH